MTDCELLCHPDVTACSVESCERPVYARGWCTAHYERWVDHGDVFADRRLRMYGRSEEERFWNRVTKTVDGCWEWEGARDRKGYGQFDKIGRAHRYAYALAYGPVPDGLVIDHLCRNPGCVRPDHLEAVSNEENLRRGKPGIAAINAAKTVCVRGHALSGHNLKIDSKGHRQCRECRNASYRRWWAKRVAEGRRP